VPFNVVAPVPTVNAVESLTVVAPLRLTVPVPVAKVLDPAMFTCPLSVFVPVVVAKVPLLADASKFPALSVKALSTVSVGSVVLGNISRLVVPWLEAQYAWTKLRGGTLYVSAPVESVTDRVCVLSVLMNVIVQTPLRVVLRADTHCAVAQDEIVSVMAWPTEEGVTKQSGQRCELQAVALDTS